MMRISRRMLRQALPKRFKNSYDLKACRAARKTTSKINCLLMKTFRRSRLKWSAKIRQTIGTCRMIQKRYRYWPVKWGSRPNKRTMSLTYLKDRLAISLTVKSKKEENRRGCPKKTPVKRPSGLHLRSLESRIIPAENRNYVKRARFVRGKIRRQSLSTFPAQCKRSRTVSLRSTESTTAG